MPDDDQRRLLAHLDANGGRVEASANLDPQWNDATAETKHYQDLRHHLADAADLDGSRADVIDLLEELVEEGLLERTVTPEGATVALTDAGAEALEEA